MNGIDLRLRRVALRITVTDLANAMGVSPSRVSHIETRDRVTPEAEAKYLAALSTLTTVPTAGPAAEVPA